LKSIYVICYNGIVEFRYRRKKFGGFYENKYEYKQCETEVNIKKGIYECDIRFASVLYLQFHRFGYYDRRIELGRKFAQNGNYGQQEKKYIGRFGCAEIITYRQYASHCGNFGYYIKSQRKYYAFFV
jgi:hypothetical protein